MYQVGSEGPRDALVACVAEKGAVEEARYGRPMVGTTGSYIREHLNKSGVDAGSGYGANIRAKGRWSREVYLKNSPHTPPSSKDNPTCAAFFRENPRIY